MTLPQHIYSYCPKCGKKGFKYQEDNSFACGECSLHVYVNAAAAVAALIVNSKGELLLTRRAINPHKGMLDLPGGFVDILETAEQAVVREIKEELGVNITKLNYFTSYPNEYLFGGVTVFTLDLAFVCEVDAIDDLQPKDDVSACEYYKLQQIPMNEIGSISMQSIIKKYIRSYKID